MAVLRVRLSAKAYGGVDREYTHTYERADGAPAAEVRSPIPGCSSFTRTTATAEFAAPSVKDEYLPTPVVRILLSYRRGRLLEEYTRLFRSAFFHLSFIAVARRARGSLPEPAPAPGRTTPRVRCPRCGAAGKLGA